MEFDENLVKSNLYNNLTEKEKILIAAKLYGYQKLPPTIDEFLDNPYYLGGNNIGPKLYPYWREFLRELFPNPIHTRWHYIALSGAIKFQPNQLH